MLDGKKTYIAAAGLFALAIYQACQGEYTQAGQSLGAALAAIGLRCAIDRTPQPPPSPPPEPEPAVLPFKPKDPPPLPSLSLVRDSASAAEKQPKSQTLVSRSASSPASASSQILPPAQTASIPSGILARLTPEEKAQLLETARDKAMAGTPANTVELAVLRDYYRLAREKATKRSSEEDSADRKENAKERPNEEGATHAN